MEVKTKKIIWTIVASVLIFAAGFGSATLIAKFRYTRSVDKLGQLLGTGKQSTEKLYTELEQRIKELDGFRAQAADLESTTEECLRIVEQSELTIGQLRGTVEEIGTTSSSIGDTIRKLREGQQRIEEYVVGLEENNTKLTNELRRIQSSPTEQ